MTKSLMYKRSNQKTAKLTLVGAGPGDPELITIKGRKVLLTADIILYDALVDQSIFDTVPIGIPRVFVGKRAGSHYKTQGEINDLIVKCAFEYGHVVRLKGGDPFVFGRGQEELAYATSFGIPTAVIPGVSSCIGVPASVGIPLTKRGCCESFWVTTGTNCKESIPADMTMAAQSSATMVILMGSKKLPQIVGLLKQYRSPDTPIALIQNGTLKTEKTITGTLEDIVSKVECMDPAAPSLIIVGSAVKDHLSGSPV